MPPERAKPRSFEVLVTEVVQETPDTVTLVLDAPQIPPYRAGQFLTIDPHVFPVIAGQVAFVEHLKGDKKELVRAYSMASAPHEPLAITVKEEPYRPGDLHAPLLSPLLVHGIPRGTRFPVVGFTGPYILSPDVEQRTDHIVHLVAGSGVVPNYAMLKWALEHEPRVRHTFVYSNKTCDDVIFGRALEQMAVWHKDRLRLVHCLTREKECPPTMPGAHLGRVDLAVLKDAIPDPNACLVYACGPELTRWDKKAAKEKGEEPRPRFLESLRELLQQLGLPRERLHQEAYG